MYTLKSSQIRKFSPDFLAKFKHLKNELINALLLIENYKTAVEEYRRSERTLKCIEMEEIINKSPVIKQCCSFLPYNNVLYSYVLYGLVPSLLAEKVFIRPSYLSSQTALKIHQLLQSGFKGKIMMEQWTRREYVNSIALQSDVILFTGKYSSIPEIKKQLRPNQLFIYNGNGLVSFIVHSDADINNAAKGAVSDRIYNSGQDCICPDVFLIHKSILEPFVKALTESLNRLHFGKNTDIHADYGSILNKEVLTKVRAFFNKKKKNIIYGGNIDHINSVIYPTIILENNLLSYNYFEFYSPVFRIYSYDSIDELYSFYKLQFQNEFKMGVSLYGGLQIHDFLKENKFIVAWNKTFFDIEHGNKPFGGYGIRASHSMINNQTRIHPILVSQEIIDLNWARNLISR